ncbi:GDP-mannose 4,6-dehydratase [Mesorhizobium sp. M1182]
MWRILLATGETHSVRSFVEAAFRQVGKEIVLEGKGVAEGGLERRSNQAPIRIDKGYFGPTEVDLLIGDASKAAPRSVGSQRPRSRARLGNGRGRLPRLRDRARLT